MGYLINNWASVETTVSPLVAGDNTPDAAAYLLLIPAEDHNRIIGFGSPPVLDGQWIMEVANADTTQSMTIDLIGGLPSQDPAQIVLPQGFTKVELPPGYTQRVAYIAGIGWAPLFTGTLM